MLRSTTAMRSKRTPERASCTNPAGNFDALAAFAGRREHLDLARRHAFGRLPAGEQVAAERREVGCGDGLEHLPLDAEGFEMTEGGEIAERHQRKRLAGVLDQAARQAELDGGLYGDVEEQQREAGERIRGLGRRLEERGAIGCRRGRELRVEAFEQRGEIRAAERQRAQLTWSDARQRELVEGSGQRAREARRCGHGREVRQLAGVRRFERRPRGDRLGPDPSDGNGAARRQDRRREVCRELGEAEAMKTQRPAAPLRDQPGEVVGGAARCADNHRPAPAVRVEPLACGIEPERGLG